MTLVASELEATDPDIPLDVKWPEGFRLPAVKLARMAIDTELQRNGWGRRLCEWAIALVKEHVSRHIGCRLLVTDAKKSAVGFYEKLGFTLLDTEANRSSPYPLMFINLTKL